MANYSYLFKYIEKGNRILLYGYGKNGRNIYQFLKENPQFQIVGIIDRNADMTATYVFPVFHPSQLSGIPCKSFDKLLITVMDQAAGREIYQIVRENGIPEEKIVAPYFYNGPSTTLSVESFIQDSTLVHREIKTFIDGQYKNLLFFTPLVESLKTLEERKDGLLPQLKRHMNVLPSVECIVFLHILYLSGLFDSELMKRLMECTLQISKNREELRQFVYSVFIDTTMMCFYHSEYLFPEFYNMRKELLKKICKMYDFSINQIEKNKNGARLKKICILYEGFYQSRENQDSRVPLCIQWSNMLVKLGYDVQILTVDPRSYVLETPIFQSIIWTRFDTSADYITSLKMKLLPQVSIQCEDKIDLKERLQAILDDIFSYDPDLIVDMSDENSILSYIYSQYFTTLYIPMRGYQSSSFFTYFAARERGGFEQENRVFQSVNENAVIVCPVCILPPEPQAVYERRNFSLENEDFVLVTVGGRLNTEMSSEFIDLICNRLLSKPNIKWLVVGRENDYLTRKYADYISSKKIIYIAYENDLPALYRICNLYINPNRMGGGASIIWAMNYGLPVATLADPNDVMPIIGIENAADNYNQMIDYALTLWSDPVFWERDSEMFRKRALEFETSMPRLIQKTLLKIEELQKI